MFLRETPEEMNIPHLCALCQGSTLPMVDTLRSNVVPAQHVLSGRQYICAECVEDIAQTYGFPTKADLESAERKTSYWRRKAQKEADTLVHLREIFSDGDNGDAPPLED